MLANVGAAPYDWVEQQRHRRLWEQQQASKPVDANGPTALMEETRVLSKDSSERTVLTVWGQEKLLAESAALFQQHQKEKEEHMAAGRLVVQQRREADERRKALSKQALADHLVRYCSLLIHEKASCESFG